MPQQLLPQIHNQIRQRLLKLLGLLVEPYPYNWIQHYFDYPEYHYKYLKYQYLYLYSYQDNLAFPLQYQNFQRGLLIQELGLETQHYFEFYQ